MSNTEYPTSKLTSKFCCSVLDIGYSNRVSKRFRINYPTRIPPNILFKRLYCHDPSVHFLNLATPEESGPTR